VFSRRSPRAAEELRGDGLPERSGVLRPSRSISVPLELPVVRVRIPTCRDRRGWRLAAVDPDILRVGGTKRCRDSRAGLHEGNMESSNRPLNRHVVRLAARDLHPQSDPEGDIFAPLAARACGFFYR
jgi:hypothetical protein